MATVAHIEVLASAGDGFRVVLMDIDDYHRLGVRSLSIGSHGYAQLWDSKKVQTLHRWLFDLSGKGYSVVVDHLNRDRLDNRRCNLRLVDGSRSNANRAPADAPFAGVYLTSRGRYEAKFTWRRQTYRAGTFRTREEAAAALLEARLRHAPDSISPQRNSTAA